MACATVKRHLESDAMYGNDVPSKRAKYSYTQNSVTPTPTTNVDLTPTKVVPQQPSCKSPFSALASKLTPEKMATNIMEEAHKLNRKKRIQFDSQQIQSTITQDLTFSTSIIHKSDGNDKPLFTYSQVGLICERMLKEQEEKIREEYEKVLNTKLAEQYETFVKFTHDQLQKKFESEGCPSYLS